MERTKAATSSIMSEAIIEFLILSIPILGRLKDKELKIIEKYMNLIEVMPGEILFKEGDSGDYVCFLVDGWLDVLKKTETGECIVISTLSKGSSVGEMAVIDNLARSATVKARTKSTLLTLSEENFNYILAEHPSIGVKILKGIASVLSTNLRKTSSMLANSMLPLG
jgi:CRP-like cAMP-binding protein